MVRKKILSREKKNNFKRKAKGRRVQSKRVSKKRTKRSSNKKIRKSFKKLRGRTRLSLRKMRGGAALEPESLELKLSLKSLESAKRRFALAKLSGKYDIPQDPLILINDHLLNIEKELMAKEPKVNEDEYKEINEDIRSVSSTVHAPREHDLEMFYSQASFRTSPYHPTPVPENNISINITINKGKKEIEIEKMEFPHDESKGAEKATHVLYYMINQARPVWEVKPDFTINVTVVTDESNIESLCRYYENMSFKKDPDHSREGGSQRLKTSVEEFLNNRIDDILIELIEIMVSNGILIQNATQLINTLKWKNELLNGRDTHVTIYNLLCELKEDFDEEDYLSEILSSDDKTKMEEIFNLYLSEV